MPTIKCSRLVKQCNIAWRTANAHSFCLVFLRFCVVLPNVRTCHRHRLLDADTYGYQKVVGMKIFYSDAEHQQQPYNSRLRQRLNPTIQTSLQSWKIISAALRERSYCQTVAEILCEPVGCAMFARGPSKLDLYSEYISPVGTAPHIIERPIRWPDITQILWERNGAWWASQVVVKWAHNRSSWALTRRTWD